MSEINKQRFYYILFIFALVVLLLTFVLNLVDWNSSANVKKSKIDRDLKMALAYSPDGIGTIQQEISQMEKENPSKELNDGDDQLARYRTAMANSILIGDSITEGFIVYGFLSEDVVYSQIGGSLLGSDDLFSAAAGAHPKNLFLAFGMNDMGNFSGDVDKFYSSYQEKIKSFKKQSPETNIFLIRIVPPSKDAISNKPVIGNYDKFNKAIAKIAKKNNLKTVGTDRIIRENPGLHESDGIHVKRDFYPLLLEEMIKASGSSI